MAPQDKGTSKAVYLTSNLQVSSFNPSNISLSLRTASGPMLGKIPKIPRVMIVNTSNRNAVKGKAMCLNRRENLERVEQEMLDRAERTTGKRKVEKSVLKKEEERRKEAEEQKKKEEEEKRKKEGWVLKKMPLMDDLNGPREKGLVLLVFVYFLKNKYLQPSIFSVVVAT